MELKEVKVGMTVELYDGPYVKVTKVDGNIFGMSGETSYEFAHYEIKKLISIH